MTVYIIFSSVIFLLLVWIYFLSKKLKSTLTQLNSAMISYNKNKVNYNAAIKLLQAVQNGSSLAKCMEQHGFSNVAVYGMGPIGKCLVKELLSDGIQVLYAIDKNAELIYADVPVYNTRNLLPQTDAIIVTAVYYHEQIKKCLEEKMKCPIVSLFDFLL